MRTVFRVLIIGSSLLAVRGVPASFAQQGATLQLAPFNAIELHNGGHVVVRPGPTPRVTVVKGRLDYSRVFVSDGRVLVIDRCRSKCPHGYELEIEIVVPNLTSISVADGGKIQSREGFPRQTELVLDVSNGGTIDVRSIVADRVAASVNQGGGIFTMPRASLVATVMQGGIITYWGDAEVKSSVQHGGAVTKGRPNQRNAPRDTP